MGKYVSCLIHLQNGASHGSAWPGATWFSVIEEDTKGGLRASAGSEVKS